MADWRDLILSEFSAPAERLTLVSDPDQLITEEGLLQAIRERGYDLVRYEDAIAFRYIYESSHRARRDLGESSSLVVVVQSDVATLPYDLVQKGRQLIFGLSDIFPNLSYQVVASLDREDLTALYQAYEQEQPDPLGANATIDFALSYVFGILPESVAEPEDILRVLLRKHYRRQHIPRLVEQRLILLLGGTQRFAEWPLSLLLSDREEFLHFLQERWPAYLDQASTERPKVHEAYHFAVPGPDSVPFGAADVRVYVDNLFREGWLKPVSHERNLAGPAAWADIGVQVDPTASVRRQRDALATSVAKTIPAADARHREWLSFAWSWAQLAELNARLPATGDMAELQTQVDGAFGRWVGNRYSGLHNQPCNPPVMVHHVPRVLAELRRAEPAVRLALVIVDGLALDQWIAIRDVLTGRNREFTLREDAVFAWAPTITSVSRQALLAGKCPLFFPSSIHDTSHDDRHWSRFWESEGIAEDSARFLKGLGEPSSLQNVESELVDSRCLVVALIVDKVDRIMHGMELGSAGMHNQIRQWAERGFLSKLFELLLNGGFCVFLTSDHGNVEARGCGRPTEGALADSKGERVRIYSNQSLRARAKMACPDSVEWPPIGLPDTYYPLLAPGRSAFVQPGSTIVSHGGVSLEELVVPFVRIERRRE